MAMLMIPLFSLVLVSLVHSPVEAANDKYTTRYDHIDVDAILKSSRLLKNYMECVMERAPCTREGLEFRKNIPDAIQNECAKCSETQKKWAGKIMAHLQQNNKGYWDEILKKYDADGTFQKRYGYGGDDDEDYEERK